MNTKLKNALLSGAVMALLTTPTWAATDAVEGETPPGSTPQAETGQPMDDTPQLAPAAPMDATPQAGADAGSTGSENPLYSHTPEELRSADVLDVNGDKVGSIKTVVADPGGETAHAVVSAGGFLGFGAREIIVSLDEIALVEDDRLQISATREELEARGDYRPEQYVELEPEKPISEFSAFEPIRDDAGPALVPPATAPAPQDSQ